ncbi:hypothetical protein [Nonomuraea sp. NPDC050310]|uniref:hypothetical protein n=1 Tax=unclassified Nonomuraea TaxID=2593643 RepID=UPI0033FF7A5D
MTPDRRTTIIDGLLDLAALLEANPDIPAPVSINVLVFPQHDTDEAMRAEVDRVAGRLGTEVNPGDHYQTALDLGRVSYKVVAISAAATARYAAEASYYGHVDPA